MPHPVADVPQACYCFCCGMFGSSVLQDAHKAQNFLRFKADLGMPMKRSKSMLGRYSSPVGCEKLRAQVGTLRLVPSTIS